MTRSTNTETGPIVFLEATGVPAFATDDEFHIIAWNMALESLLGYSAEEVMGKACWDTVRGNDISGNVCCYEGCSVSQMLCRKKPVHSFEIDVRKASGALARLIHSTMLVRGEKPSRFIAVHSLQPVQPANRRGDGDGYAEGTNGSGVGNDVAALAATVIASGDGRPELTVREVEILQYLAEGCTKQSVANSLGIEVTTVRTHTQNILRKCAAHNIRQAISVARSHCLI